MQKISIENMGPIRSLSVSLNKEIDIIIGPQASGKSTFAKIIYFCKKIRDYYIEYMSNNFNFIKNNDKELYLNFSKFIRMKFMGFFGTTKHMDKFCINYNYSETKSVKIYLDNRYVKVVFSEELKKLIQESLKKFYDLYLQNEKKIYSDILNTLDIHLQFINDLKPSIISLGKEIFSDEDDIIYIPAGRSLLAVLSEQLDVVNINGLDLPMKDFIERIRLVKKSFGSKLDNIVSDYVKTIKGQIKNNDLDIAQKLINNILRGEYLNDTDSEKLYIDKVHWVKLIYASSGQQEALWILLLLFMSILTQKKAFFIIEEPEAHLYPAAQYKIMELIALTVNSINCHILITTHSPYILSSTNLLIYSGLVEGKLKLGTKSPIIKKQLRIAFKSLNAYKITEEKPWEITTITDEETGMIDSYQIDTISSDINNNFEKLLELES